MNNKAIYFDRETLLQTIPQLMGFCMLTFPEFGLKLAMLDKLGDLKGLVSTVVESDVDFEL